MKTDRSPEAIVRAIVADVTLMRVDHIGLDDDLPRLLSLDSLSLLRIIADIESEFGVHVPDEEFHTLRTLRAMLSYVEGAGVAT